MSAEYNCLPVCPECQRAHRGACQPDGGAHCAASHCWAESLDFAAERVKEALLARYNVIGDFNGGHDDWEIVDANQAELKAIILNAIISALPNTSSEPAGNSAPKKDIPSEKCGT